MTYSLISERTLRSQETISNPNEVFDFLKTRYLDRREQFFVMTLNGANQVESIHLVSIGIANRTLVHPREVFFPAVKEGAVSILLAHNHPSGNLTPSNEDREITSRLRAAGELLGIQVLDHIIFSHEGYHSMLEQGELEG